MTADELNLTEVSWGDHRVRFIQLDGGAYVPVGDIAKATGVRKRAYHNLMDKYSDEFKVHERGVRLSSPGGLQETRCIDSEGAYGLLKLISANHIKNEDTRKNLIEFKEWIHQRMLGQVTLPEITTPYPPLKEPTPKPRPDYDHILAELTFVKKLSKETGWDLQELRVAVLRDHNLYSLAMVGERSKPAELPLALPAPAPEKKFKGFYTATDIGKLGGKTAEEVHKWLYQHNPPFIIKGEGDEWRLTEYGKEFAYEHPYCPPNTLILRNRIEWKPSILEKMNIHQQKATT